MNEKTCFHIKRMINHAWFAVMSSSNILDYDRHFPNLSVDERNELNHVWGLLLEAHNRAKTLVK